MNMKNKWEMKHLQETALQGPSNCWKSWVFKDHAPWLRTHSVMGLQSGTLCFQDHSTMKHPRQGCFQDHLSIFKALYKACFEDHGSLFFKKGEGYRSLLIMAGITWDPFVLGMVQRHLSHFNQKPPLVKPSHKCEVKIPKVQEAAASSDWQNAIWKDNRARSREKKGFLLAPVSSPKTMGKVSS